MENANVKNFPNQENQEAANNQQEVFNINGIGLAKVLGRCAAMVGGGAVIGAILKGQDLSGLKGIGKACAGIGIIGLSHAAGTAAGDAIERDIDNAGMALKFLFGDNHGM